MSSNHGLIVRAILIYINLIYDRLFSRKGICVLFYHDLVYSTLVRLWLEDLKGHRNYCSRDKGELN